METSFEPSTSSSPPGSRGSPFKSSVSERPTQLSPVLVSSGLHLMTAGAFALVMALGSGKIERVEIEVIDKPTSAPQLDLANQPPPKPQESVAPARKVFGKSREALTSDEPGPGVAVKTGNTVATVPDNEKLRDSDQGSLPIPTDEYLVSKMPSVTSEIRIPYPPEARTKKIEGKVVLELLIDATGAVREVKLVSGPGYGLNEAAQSAIKQFKFRPAEVDGKPVAVRIPFTYNFLLKSD